MMEQQLKKHAIGFNKISSVDGVINARGVKSKPNDLEIYGYTNEIGEGEKSPDNPYILQSLDSGNVNLYSEDKITSCIFSNKTILGIKLSHPRSGYYCIRWDSYSGGRAISYNLIELSTNTASTYSYFRTNSIITVPDGYDIIFFDINDSNSNALALTQRTNLMILDSPIMPDEYITDEHSIVLSNNDTTIQVPVPIPLNSVEGVSDYIFKDSDGVWKLVQNNKKYEFIGNENIMLQSINDYEIANFWCYINDAVLNQNFLVCNMLKKQLTVIASTKNEGFFRTKNQKILYLRIETERASTVEEFKNFLSEQYENGTPLTIIYQLETPIEHTLSDYAQDLLNSFELQNQNRIFVEGHPDIKVSGYIQK